MEEWLALLHDDNDDDFRVQARPYFDNTQAMNVFIEEYKGKHRK